MNLYKKFYCPRLYYSKQRRQKCYNDWNRRFVACGIINIRRGKCFRQEGMVKPMECPGRSDNVRTDYCSLNFIMLFSAKSVLHLSTLVLIIFISIKHTLLVPIKHFKNLTPMSHTNSMFSFFFIGKLIKITDTINMICVFISYYLFNHFQYGFCLYCTNYGE